MQHILCSKERGKRLGALVMTLVMVFFAMTAALPAAEAVTQKDIDNLKSQAASLKEQKSDIQKKLDKLSNSKNSALDQKFLLEEKINVLREQIALSEQSIQEYGKQIDQKEEELAAAKEEEAKYYDEFCERVRSMEERGNVSYWAVLFNANSFSDLLDQINAISEVMDYDNEVMDNLAAARQAVADAKAELEESKAAEESAKADLETQKADLVKEQASVEATIQEITSQSSVYAQKMDELEDDSASVSSQIAQAEKTYQAQIAAQKKAEEEAARKKAEEEAKKQKELAGDIKASNSSRIRTTPILTPTPNLPVAVARPVPAATCGRCRGIPGCLLPLAIETVPSTGRSSTVAVIFPPPMARPLRRPRAAWSSFPPTALPMATM